MILTIAFALGLPLAVAGPAGAQQSYPLTCKIGTMNSEQIGGPLPIQTLEFSKSTAPASSGLQPGQCAWTDRGFKPSEPSQICFHAGISGIVITNGTPIAGTFTGPGAALAKAAAVGPTTLMNFSVHAGSTIGPCLIVDQYGP
jgi:hypothetical protein